MARKIKIWIDTEETKLKLPAIPLRFLPSLASIALRWSNKQNPDNVRISPEAMKHFLKEVAEELEGYEPFTLVAIDSPSAKVLVRVK